MLRINLLPPYVAQRRVNNRLIALFTTIFLLTIVAFLAVEFIILVPKSQNEKQLAEAAVAAHTLITNEQTQATNILSAIGPITDKLTFFQNVQTYNHAYIDLYRTVAKYTSPKVLYTSMAVSGSTLTINAYTPSIDELGRYLQVMYREPDISAVSISSVPTPDQAALTVYEYKGTVIGVTGGPGSSSTSGSSPRGGGMQSGTMSSMRPMGGGQGGSTTASIPGVPAGVSVNLPPGVTIPGQASTGLGGNGQMGQYGGSNLGGQYGQMGQYGQQSMSGLPSLTPSMRSSGMGQQGMGGSNNIADAYSAIMALPDFNPKYWKVKIIKTDGFVFTATCTLKKPLSPPSPPGGGGAPASTNGMGGGVPGTMGGMRPMQMPTRPTGG